jgi:ssDNA-binding replication factor A large subunit
MLYQIKDLKKDLKKVNIVIKLIGRLEPRYAKGYKITTYIGADSTGRIFIPFWNNDGNTVKVGDFIEIENGYISSFQGKLQLNIGKFGSFQHVPPPENFQISLESPLESEGDDDVEVTPVEQLAQQTKNLTLCLYVKEKIEERVVHTKLDGKEHIVATYIVGDATGCIHLNLWDELNYLIQVGTSIKVQGAYVRTYNGILYLNISKTGKISPYAGKIQIDNINNLSIKVINS